MRSRVLYGRSERTKQRRDVSPTSIHDIQNRNEPDHPPQVQGGHRTRPGRSDHSRRGPRPARTSCPGLCSLHSPSSTSRDLTPCSCFLPFQIVDALDNADPDIDTITLSNAPGSSGQRFALDALYGRSVADLGFKYVPCSPQSHLAGSPSSASPSHLNLFS